MDYRALSELLLKLLNYLRLNLNQIKSKAKKNEKN